VVDLLCTFLDGVEEVHCQPEAVCCKIMQGGDFVVQSCMPWSWEGGRCGKRGGINLVTISSVNKLLHAEQQIRATYLVQPIQ